MIISSPAVAISSETTNSKICISISPAGIGPSNVIVPIFAIPSTDVKPSGIINVISTFSADTFPWLNTVTLKETVSPGYTLSSSPGANVMFDAKSNIETSIGSISLSSSSPPALSISSFTVVSLSGSLSATLSISSGFSPKSSVAL